MWDIVAKAKKISPSVGGLIAETGWHRHGYDYVVVPGMDSKLLLETADCDGIAELKAGQSYYRPVGVEHNVVNANEFEFYFVEIELR